MQEEIAGLRPTIESHVEDSPLKHEILKLYTQYEPLGKVNRHHYLH